MPERRVLHVIDKFSVDGSKMHGPARQIAYRVPQYDEGRYRVLLCGLREEEAGSRELRQRGLEVVTLGRGKFDPRALLDLWRLIRRWRPDVIHLSGYAAWTFGRLAAALAGAPVIVQEHFVDPRVPWYQRVSDWCLRGMQVRGIAVAEPVREFMQRTRCLNGTPIDVIPNGIPLALARPSLKDEAAGVRERLGIPATARLIGIVGRLAPMKGHAVFLEAARRVAQRRPDAWFLVVGEGGLRTTLERQAQALGLSGRVIFAGYQAEVLPYLAACDASVIASVYGEGFCSVGIESFLARTPVVMSEIACVDGVYEHRRNVVRVPAGDAAALAWAIEEVLADRQLAGRLRQGGQETLARCEISESARRYQACYDAVLAAAGGERARPAPRSIPARLPGLRRDACLAAAAAMAIYAAAIVGGRVVLGKSAQSKQTHYAYLAEALLHGRVDIDAAMAPWLDELVERDGRHYVIYPPMPALVLLPWVAAFGPGVPTSLVSILLAGGCVGAAYAMLRRAGFAREVSAWTSAFFAFGTGFWYTALKGSSWHFAHVSASLFLCLALAEAFGRRRPWLVGLSLGAATLSRLPVGLTAPVVLWWVARASPGALRRAAGFLLAFGACVAVEALYNQARYGTFVEAGYSMLPAAQARSAIAGLFDLRYLPRNLWMTLFQPPLLIERFPYLVPTAHGLSLLFASPALLLAFRAPGSPLTFGAVAAALAAALPGLLYGLGVHNLQVGSRYALDYMPLLLLLVAAGIGARLSRGVKALLAFNVLIGCWGLAFTAPVEAPWLPMLERFGAGMSG